MCSSCNIKVSLNEVAYIMLVYSVIEWHNCSKIFFSFRALVNNKKTSTPTNDCTSASVSPDISCILTNESNKAVLSSKFTILKTHKYLLKPIKVTVKF